MENEKDTSPLFDLIKSGKDEKKTESDGVTDFGAQPVDTAEEPAIPAPEVVGDGPQTRMQSMLGARNKGLTMRYDTAMLILLALVGLVVIAYLWGHYAGRRLGLIEGRSIAVEAREPSGGENANDGASGESGLQIPADDGAIERPYYMLQIYEAGPSNRVKCEEIKREIEGKFFVEILESRQGGGNWRLLVGRFKDKNSEQAKRFKAYFEKKYPECLFIKRTP